MWKMQEFGIQNERTITTTRTPLTTRSTRSTRSTTPNPTMFAATWNTWWTRENARSVSVFVVRLCLAVVTLISCSQRMAQDGRVLVSLHPRVIAMHAWSERSLWLPWPLRHTYFPPLIHHYPQAVLSTLQLHRGQVARSPVHSRQGDGV